MRKRKESNRTKENNLKRVLLLFLIIILLIALFLFFALANNKIVGKSILDFFKSRASEKGLTGGSLDLSNQIPMNENCLCVYNLNSALSKEICEYYNQTRYRYSVEQTSLGNYPYSQEIKMLGLDLPNEKMNAIKEEMNLQDFESYIEQPIVDYVDSHPELKITHIALAKDIPFRIIDYGFDSPIVRSGVSYLTFPDYYANANIVFAGDSSPYHRKMVHFDPEDYKNSLGDYTLRFVVSYLTGYNINDIKNMIDKAVSPVEEFNNLKWIMDIDEDGNSLGRGELFQTESQLIYSGVKSSNIVLDSGNNRPVSTSGEVIGYYGPGVYHAGYGEGLWTTYVDSFGVKNFEFDVSTRAILGSYESFNAVTFTGDYTHPDSMPIEWRWQGKSADAFSEKAFGGEDYSRSFSGAIGNVEEPSGAIPASGKYFLPGYAHGLTLAESILTVDSQRSTNIVVGDPLMRITDSDKAGLGIWDSCSEDSDCYSGNCDYRASMGLVTLDRKACHANSGSCVYLKNLGGGNIASYESLNGSMRCVDYRNPNYSPSDDDTYARNCSDGEWSESYKLDKNSTNYFVCSGVDTSLNFSAIWKMKGINECQYPSNCNDDNPCTSEYCYSHKTCIRSNNSNICDDNLFCTENDMCNLGSCGGNPISISDSVRCTVDSCDEDLDRIINTADNNLCNDNLFCNGEETCSMDLDCLTGISPSDNIACTIDSCDEALDIISYMPDNSLCADGLYCNGVEICNAISGCLSGTSVNCADAISCTLDTCEEGLNSNDNLGNCVHNPANCGCLTDINCNDNNACTDDKCVNYGCENKNNNTNICTDNLFCTINDRCSSGNCVSESRVCNDNSDLTVDSCDEIEYKCAFADIIPDISGFNSDLTTNLSLVSNISKVENFSIGLLGKARIQFLNETLDLKGINLSKAIIIGENYVEINVSLFFGFNKSAVITLYNISFVNPVIKRDNQTCSDCRIINHSNNTLTLVYSVNHWTAYIVEEGLYCGNGVCDSSNGETCSSCSNDCGACPPGGAGGGGGGGGGAIPRNNTNVTINNSNPILNLSVIEEENELKFAANESESFFVMRFSNIANQFKLFFNNINRNKVLIYSVVGLLVLGLIIAIFFIIRHIKKSSKEKKEDRWQKLKEEAKELILNARKEGYSEEEIKEMFKEKGWTEEEIKEIFLINKK